MNVLRVDRAYGVAGCVGHLMAADTPIPAAPLKPVSASQTTQERRAPRTTLPAKDHVDRRACWHCITAGMLIADPADNNLSRSCCEGQLARPHRCARDVKLREFAAGARSRSTGPARRVHSCGHRCALMPGSARRCLPLRDLL